MINWEHPGHWYATWVKITCYTVLLVKFVACLRTVILEGKCVLPGENARPYIKETDYKEWLWILWLWIFILDTTIPIKVT